jgi:hypothetical protein
MSLFNKKKEETPVKEEGGVGRIIIEVTTTGNQRKLGINITGLNIDQAYVILDMAKNNLIKRADNNELIDAKDLNYLG